MKFSLAKFMLAIAAVALLVGAPVGKASAFGRCCGGLGIFRPKASSCQSPAQGQALGCPSCGQGASSSFAMTATMQCPAGFCPTGTCSNGTCAAGCPNGTCIQSFGPTMAAPGGPIVNPNWQPIQVGQPLPTAPLAPGGITCRMVLVNGQWVKVCQ